MDTMVRGKQATPERWQKALQRAKVEGLAIYKIAGTGQAVVTSARDRATVYATDGMSCECEAATLFADPVCKHRALYCFDGGMLIDDSIAPVTRPIAIKPPPTVRIVAMETCPDCHGDGYGRMYTGGRMSDWISCDCHRCDNTGRIAVDLFAA